MGLVYLMVAGLAVVFAWYVWDTWHASISYLGLKWTWHLLGVLDWPWMPGVIGQWRFELAQLASAPEVVGLSQLNAAMNTAGYVYVALPIGLAMRGIFLAMQHRSRLTRRRINATTLPWHMAKHAPAIIPALHYGDPQTLLLNVNPEEHRSAVNPEEWVATHGLLVNRQLDKVRCRQLLIADLGTVIDNLQALTPHERTLFAVFAARLFGVPHSVGESQTLLDALNRSCHHGTHQGQRGYPDLALTEAAFARWSRDPNAQTWLQKHPYPQTLLHAMHQATMRTGALPSSHFRWLKGMDRGLWYALNTTGRKTPFMESAAVFTQTQWETFAFEHGYQLSEPCIEDAVTAVEDYLIKQALMAKRPQVHNNKVPHPSPHHPSQETPP
jgi:intracellular multiplication protein IcmP